MHRRNTIWTFTAAAALLAALAFLPETAAAQLISVNAGATPSARVLPNGKLTVPIIIDLTNAGATNIASLTTGVNWGPTHLTFDSLRVDPGLGWTFTPNIGGVAGGNLSFTVANAAPLLTSGTIANIYFTGSATPGGTRVTLGPTAGANNVGTSILSLLQLRRLDACVVLSGKWGDATNDGIVNIVDAQQIARSSVGLSVLDANGLGQRGDVTADGIVNIVDAQQIARFSVGLSASPRTATESFVPPTVDGATMSAATTTHIPAGGTVQLAATQNGAGNMVGCESFTWTSNHPEFATVNASGFVTAIANGTALITATSITNPAVSVSISVFVETPLTLRIQISHVGRPAKQYIAEMTSPDLGQAEGHMLTSAGMNSGTLDIPLPVQSLYAVRIVAIDAASGTDPLVIAGGWFTISTPANGIVPFPITLTAPSYSVTSIPTTVQVGVPITVGWTITDPAYLLDGPVRHTQFCGAVHFNMTTLPSDFFGTQSNACTGSNLGVGIMTYTNSATPIAGQTSAGSLKLQVRAGQYVRTGVGQASDLFVHWLSPSVTRGETPLSIAITTPVVSVTVTPPNPTRPIGVATQMVGAPRNAAGDVIGGFTATWSSSNPAVATISPTGVATGLANGTTTITATMGGVSGSTTLTIAGGITAGSISVGVSNTSLNGNGTTSAFATVLDGSGNVIPGAVVVWSSSNFRVARIAQDGSIQAIGAGTSDITATIGGVSGFSTVTVNPTSPSFNIDLRALTSMSPGATAAFANAVTRWQTIIRGDIPNIPLSNFDVSPCLGQSSGTTKLTETVDDVIIYASVAPIDGAGGILGQAGPCVVRTTGGQAVIGVMTFDSADIANMEAAGTLTAVILHEMGHVLGIGTNWGTLLLNPAPSPDVGDPTFTGINAQWAFQNLGTSYGGAIVPVENCCAAGTRNAHWRESVLARELMTGFITSSGGINPLSPLTAASLIDIGYVVDVNQSDFPPSFLRSIVGDLIRIGERVIEPTIAVDANGHVVGSLRVPGPPPSRIPPRPPRE